MEVLIKPGDLVLLSFKNTGCNACKEQRVTSKQARTHSHSCDVITARLECSELPLHYVVNKRRSEARSLQATGTYAHRASAAAGVVLGLCFSDALS